MRSFDDKQLLAAAEFARRSEIYDRAINTADRTREALFSMLTSRVGSFEGLAVADLFAGSGALGKSCAALLVYRTPRMS